MLTQNQQESSFNIQIYRYKILRLFVYYCSFGDRENYIWLKIQNYRRMLIDMQIVSTDIEDVRYDLIFSQSNHRQKCMSFQQFISKIPKIGQLKYTDYQDSTSLLIRLHFVPLDNCIIENTAFGKQLKQLNMNRLSLKSFKLFKKVEDILYSLYRTYFSKAKQVLSGDKDQQFKIICQFCRDFNLMPKLLSKPLNYLLFMFLFEKQSTNAYNYLFKSINESNAYKFTFIHFLEYLIFVTLVTNQQNSQESQVLQINKLLERLQISKGFHTLTKNLKFKRSLFLTQQEIKQIYQDITNITTPTTPTKKYSKLSQQTQHIIVQSPIKYQLGDYYQTLKIKFTKLCAKKIAESNFYMNNVTAKKLISCICPKFSNQSIDILLASVGRLNFTNFIQLLKKISQMEKIKLTNLYNQVALYNTGEFSLSLIFQNMKLDQKQYDLCKKVLQIADNFLKSLFNYYQTDRYLSLASYTRLLQQTNVTPNIVNISQIPDIFDECSGSFKIERMHFDEFKNSLILIILSVQFDNNIEGVERLIYLLEKVSNSKKGQILHKKNIYDVKQDPLYALKIKFSHIYQKIQGKLKNCSSINHSRLIFEN